MVADVLAAKEALELAVDNRLDKLAVGKFLGQPSFISRDARTVEMLPSRFYYRKPLNASRAV